MFSVDTQYDPVSDTVQLAAVFGPQSNPVGCLKLLLSLARLAQTSSTLTVTQVPGSLLDCPGMSAGIDEDLLRAFPRRLLVREYQLTMKAAENGNFNDLPIDIAGVTLTRSERVAGGAYRHGEDSLDRNPS